MVEAASTTHLTGIALPDGTVLLAPDMTCRDAEREVVEVIADMARRAEWSGAETPNVYNFFDSEVPPRLRKRFSDHGAYTLLKPDGFDDALASGDPEEIESILFPEAFAPEDDEGLLAGEADPGPATYDDVAPYADPPECLGEADLAAWHARLRQHDQI